MTANFESLYENFYPKIYSYVFHKTANKEDTEDILSEVFVKIFLKHHTYDPLKANMYTWMLTITKNTLVDYYKKQKVVPFDINSLEFTDLEYIDTYKKFIMNYETKDQVLSALKKLNKVERTVIDLRFFSDFSYQQISDQLGYSIGHVGVILGRALKKLKKTYYE